MHSKHKCTRSARPTSSSCVGYCHHAMPTPPNIYRKVNFGVRPSDVKTSTNLPSTILRMAIPEIISSLWKPTAQPYRNDQACHGNPCAPIPRIHPRGATPSGIRIRTSLAAAHVPRVGLSSAADTFHLVSHYCSRRNRADGL